MGNSYLDAVLPVYGENRTAQVPIWDESRKFFIINEHESQAGNRSYDGVRVTDRFAIVLHIGHYHSFCYINSMDLYVFDGTQKKMVQKKDYGKVFYNEEMIQKDLAEMMASFLKSQMVLMNRKVDTGELERQSVKLIESSYYSLLDDHSKNLLNVACAYLTK